jgi:hypothetical protein
LADPGKTYLEFSAAIPNHIWSLPFQKQIFSHTQSQHSEPFDFVDCQQSDFAGVFPYTA